MSLIQITLVLCTILLLIPYFVFLQSTLRDRILSMVLFCTALVAILFPDVTTVVANWFGVGRGTNLLVYLFMPAATFAFIVLSTRILRLEDSLTRLTREISIAGAKSPSESAPQFGGDDKPEGSST